MTLIREISDIHNEFGILDLPEMPEDKETVLIIAGDCSVNEQPRTFKGFFADLADRFKAIIYIPGNHEYYGGSLARVDDKYREFFKDFPNIHFLNKETVIIDNVAFICATLWTDFKGGDPVVLQMAGMYMNDYRAIRFGTKGAPYTRRVKPIDILGLHKLHKEFIYAEVRKARADGLRTVVVSHHAPSTLSVPERFKYRGNDAINYCYANSLEEEFILDEGPDIWFHGHTHDSFDYTLGNTRVICNPRGYEGHELNPEFDPCLRILL